MNDKIFDEWNEIVDCNECEKYWLNQCDGVPIDDAKRCNSYVAIRSGDILKRMDKLELSSDVNFLVTVLLAVILFVHIFI